MALAHSTPIAISANEHKTIEEFQTGDIVYVADKSSGELCWSDAQVKFSAGTGPKSEWWSPLSMVRTRIPWL